MKKFINNLKLIHKLNIVFYIAIVISFVLITVFSNILFRLHKHININHTRLIQVYRYNREIKTNLDLLNHIVLHNALVHDNQYKNKIQNANIAISENLKLLKEDEFFKNSLDAVQKIAKIKIRITGYNTIVSEFEEEFNDSVEDGMYATLALTSASAIVSKELNVISSDIESISEAKTRVLQEQIFRSQILIIFIVILIFIFMWYINRYVYNSILSQLHHLKEGVSSFFDLLSKKRDKAIPMQYVTHDEISKIAKIIDDNIHIAENLLSQEREESHRIEIKVAEATQEIRALNSELEATQNEILLTMGTIAEERSKETGLHIKRVAIYSFILARLAGVPFDEAILLKNASPMHDMGKIGIPDSVLNKPAKLTDEEFEIMKTHAEVGYKMLNHSQRPMLKTAAIVAYEHHEKWNGTGYPRGLKAEEIHIYGRITAIADVFDALGSDRVYKKAWKLEKIVNLFESERGKHFDPELVDIFLDNLEHFLAAKENIEQGKEDNSLYNIT